jgi:predicted DNA-binding transcriptional regulator YafY
LTQSEVKALFMLSVPDSLEELGVSGELRTAMRKIAAALPEKRNGEEVFYQYLHLDWKDWSRDEKRAPYLQEIYQAVRDSRKIDITYTEVIAGGNVGSFRKPVEPYGLVAKAGDWYLVCADTGHRLVFRVSSIVQVAVTNETFTRLAGFNLAAFWKDWCAAREQEWPSYPVKARISPEMAGLMKLHFGERIREAVEQAGPPDEKRWIEVVLPYETLFDARRNILNLGNAVEVLEPEAFTIERDRFLQSR